MSVRRRLNLTIDEATALRLEGLKSVCGFNTTCAVASSLLKLFTKRIAEIGEEAKEAAIDADDEDFAEIFEPLTNYEEVDYGNPPVVKRHKTIYNG